MPAPSDSPHGSPAEPLPNRAAWLMILMALRLVRSVSVRPVVGLMNCLPPAGWLPNEVPAAG
jgi:hypothetical protein